MNEHLRYALAAALLNHWRASQEGVAFGRVKSFSPIKEDIGNALSLPTSSCRSLIQSLTNSTKRRHVKNIRHIFENDPFFVNNNVATSAASLRNDVIVRVSMATSWMDNYNRVVQAISNEEDEIIESLALFGRPITTYDVHEKYRYIKQGTIVDVSTITASVRSLISQTKRIVSLVNFITSDRDYSANIKNIKSGNIKLLLVDPEFIDDIFRCKTILFKETDKAQNERMAREKLESFRTKIKPLRTTPRLSVSDVHRPGSTQNEYTF